VARGLVALFPLELPILQPVAAGDADRAPAPVGMSLPMAG
jgi:hypothetical protein